MKYSTHHETLGHAVSEINTTLRDSRNEVELVNYDAFTEAFQFDDVSYGKTREAHAEIKTIHGKSTRKYAHAAIYRMDSGRYELTLYIA